MSTDREDARTGSRTLAYIVAAIFLVVLVILVARGCHESNSREDVINPDDPLPGAQTAIPVTHSDAVPLLRAA